MQTSYYTYSQKQAYFIGFLLYIDIYIIIYYNSIKRYAYCVLAQKFLTMEKKLRSEKEQHVRVGVIQRILSQEEALALRARPGVSVGVVAVIVKYEDNKAQAITITEKNKRDTYTKTKFPSGGLEFGEHPYAGIKREARTETGYDVDDIEFVCGAEYSTTIPGETHYKLFFLVRKHVWVGTPIFDGEDEILSVDWCIFGDIEHRIPKTQRSALQPIMNKMMSIDAQYAYALMNTKTSQQWVEGVYDITKPPKD